jgi:pimeloyl-ACP methyl ester carboxylesterase
MDDPCNLTPAQQELVGLGAGAGRGPSYPYELVDSDSEADDIDCVVDFIRRLRGVDKVTLVGWSGGGCRAGTYALRHPEKVERLVIFASSNYRREGMSEPPVLPKPGAAVSIQTREIGEGRRWLGTARRREMIEPDMPGLIWNLSLTLDPLGATWGTGGLRAPTRTYWGWNARGAAQLVLPTLIMVGEQDALIDANQKLFDDLGAQQKIFLAIADGTHFMGWEKQSRVLHRASRDWILEGTFEGRTQGRLRADGGGRVSLHD